MRSKLLSVCAAVLCACALGACVRNYQKAEAAVSLPLMPFVVRVTIENEQTYAVENCDETNDCNETVDYKNTEASDENENHDGGDVAGARGLL